MRVSMQNTLGWYSARVIPSPWNVVAHIGFEALGYLAAALLYVRLKRRGDVIASPARASLVAAACVGAALGSRLLTLLEDPARVHWRDVLMLDAGKTIIGGILGAWLAVEWVKRRTGVTERTGDLFVYPLALGTCIGRVGCFLAGLSDGTVGRATTLPLGVNFGDGVMRHPLPLYEIAGVVLIVVVLRSVPVGRNGDLFRLYVFGYMGLRFALEFLKETPRFGGFTTLQWAALAGMVACSGALVRVFRREEVRVAEAAC